MKVAIVHYWLTGMRGGERVLESLCDIYPDADIFTHAYLPHKVSKKISRHKVITSFISRLPFSSRLLEYYLPLMPLALEQLDLSGYDLVISSESGPAKGVVTAPDAVHVCYCHSPMRYIWDMYHEYLRNFGFLKRLLAAPVVHYLKFWDFCSSARVDYFVSNSSFVSRRLEKVYRRESVVLNPPVQFEEFYISPHQGDYFLFVGQLLPYKRPDLAVKAFIKSGRKLIVVGEGECKKDLLNLAREASNVEILGHQTFEQIKRLYSGCKALIFPGVEDFGIVPLEAMASGRPVIALREGGALDSVIDGKTGLFFDEPTIGSLNDAVERFEEGAISFDSVSLREYARNFSEELFKEKFESLIEQFVAQSKF